MSTKVIGIKRQENNSELLSSEPEGIGRLIEDTNDHPKNIILYGGGGFIGSHIVEYLIERKFNITVFDRLDNLSKNNLNPFLDKIEFIPGDFNNIIDIKKSLKGKDYVIHLVSSTIPADSNVNKIYDIETNLISTLKLLDECVRNNIKKIIFISSGGTVYGRTNNNPITEEHPTDPICSYGIVKLAIEKYLELYRNLYNLNYTVLRLSNPFGEKHTPKKGQGFIETALYKIFKGDVVEIWGNGNTVRDYIYVKDAAKAIYLSLIANTKYNLFNISSGKGYKINDILDIFRNMLKLDFNVSYLPSRNSDVPVNVLANNRAIEYLKWKPETTLEDAINKCWYYITLGGYNES